MFTFNFHHLKIEELIQIDLGVGALLQHLSNMISQFVVGSSHRLGEFASDFICTKTQSSAKTGSSNK